MWVEHRYELLMKLGCFFLLLPLKVHLIDHRFPAKDFGDTQMNTINCLTLALLFHAHATRHFENARIYWWLDRPLVRYLHVQVSKEEEV